MHPDELKAAEELRQTEEEVFAEPSEDEKARIQKQVERTKEFLRAFHVICQSPEWTVVESLLREGTIEQSGLSKLVLGFEDIQVPITSEQMMAWRDGQNSIIRFLERMKEEKVNE